MSHGRGIEIFKGYDEIISYIKENHSKNPGSKWVVQKYIENPLLLNRRKFDIRQWVLVSDWNPLTVWAFNDSYVRFAASDYDKNHVEKSAHLSCNDDNGSDDEQEYDNIWSSKEFAAHIQKHAHRRHPEAKDIYRDVIWP